jgi:hypothetical protein
MSYPASKRWVAKEWRKVWGADALGDACRLGRGADCFLHSACVEMVAAQDTRAGVFRNPLGGKDELPAPLGAGVRIFAFEGIREIDAAVIMRQILLVQSAHMNEVLL